MEDWACEFIVGSTSTRRRRATIASVRALVQRLGRQTRWMIERCRRRPAEDLDDTVFAAVDNAARGWSWRRSEISSDVKALLKTQNAIYDDETTEENIYLTFDCGYENGNTSRILDALGSGGVQACFFITGAYLKRNRILVQRMLHDGHVVGNHSQNHLGLPSLKVSGVKAEILKLDRDFHDLFGRRMTYFRPPRGEYSPRSLAVTASLGYTTVFWSLAYDDWNVEPRRGKAFAFNKIARAAEPGLIVLLHTVSADNVDAMPAIVEDLRERGYRFKSLDDIR